MRWAGGLVLAGVVACGSDASLEGRPCPCASGYTCCVVTNRCVERQLECVFDVIPKESRLRIGAEQRFDASLQVTWSVEEPSGGTIDAAGRYTAPLVPGTYHVKAKTSQGATAIATVVVGPSNLTRLLGFPGGKGTADGIGADARFSGPGDIVSDGKFLYVADSPSDSNGQLPVGEADSSGVRRVSTSTREVSWLVRGRQFEHLAHDAAGLFATTFPAATEIVRIDPESGAVSSLSDTKWGETGGLAGDGAGVLYFTEWLGAATALRSLRVATGEVTTLVASPSWAGPAPAHAPFNGLGKVAVHDGQAYVVGGKSSGEWAQQSIWKYDPKSGALTELQTALSDGSYTLLAQSLCLDKEGVAIGITKGYCVGSLQKTPCEWSFFSSGEQLGGVVCGGAWGYGSSPEGFYLTGRRSGTILHGFASFAGQPAYDESDSVGPYMRLRGPNAISADSKGNLAVFDGVNEKDYPVLKEPGRFLRIGSDLHLAEHSPDTACAAYPSNHFNPWQRLAHGPDGTLYYLGYSTLTNKLSVVELDMETGACSQFAEVPTLVGEGFDLVHDGVASLYTSECTTPDPRVVRLDASGAIETLLSGYCGHLAISDDGQVFVASVGPFPGNIEAVGAELVRLDLGSRDVRVLATPPDGWAATALAYDPAGVLYVAEAGRQRIRALIVETGEVFDVVGKVGSQGVQLGPLPASLNTPFDIALLPDGSLAITDFAENVLLVAQ